MRIAQTVALLAALVLSARAARAADDDLKFIPLFNGKDLDGWVPVNVAPGTFTVKDGVIHSTGSPTGIMRTERHYENFVIELEWMHEKPAGNAGLFLWGDPLPALGTPFSRGIEIQILDDAYVTGEAREQNLYTGHGDVFSIQGASMTPDRPHPRGWQRCLPSERRAKPAGEWNHYRVEARNGVVTLAVNGKVVAGGRDCRPRKGYLCLESEGSPARFRNIRIAELPPGDAKREDTAALDEGFKSLYTGVDLTGWAKEPGHKGHWAAKDWTLAYDGKADIEGKTLRTEREFGDATVTVDWRVAVKPKDAEKGKARAGMHGAITVRGTKLIVPLSSNSDANPPGQWNRTAVTVNGDRLSVRVNGKEVTSKEQVPGLAPRGSVALMGGDQPMEFANLFVKEETSK